MPRVKMARSFTALPFSPCFVACLLGVKRNKISLNDTPDFQEKMSVVKWMENGT